MQGRLQAFLKAAQHLRASDSKPRFKAAACSVQKSTMGVVLALATQPERRTRSMLATRTCMRHDPAYLLIAPFPLSGDAALPAMGGLAAGLPPLGLFAPAAGSPSASLLRCFGSSRLRSLRLLYLWRVWSAGQKVVQQHHCQFSQVLSRDAAVCSQVSAVRCLLAAVQFENAMSGVRNFACSPDRAQ